MKTLKKISAMEFRLHAKNFVVDFSPINYFEKLRFTILFSRLLFWFFRKYGIYLFSYKFRLLDQKVLFQFFFYRTHYFVRNWRLRLSRRLIWSSMPLVHNKWMKKKKFTSLMKYLATDLMPEGLWHSYKKKNSNLLLADLNQFRTVRAKIEKRRAVSAYIRKKQFRLRRWLDQFKFYQAGSSIYFMRHWQREKFIRDQVFPIRGRGKKPNTLRLKKIYFNFFFMYFFIHFFKLQSIVLYKSMYKLLLANKVFKIEHRFLLKRLRYLRKYNWAFDFLFIFHYAINFVNFDFVLPFFIYHVKNSYKQRPFLTVLFNVAKAFYYLKTHIRGMKIIVHGPYDRHGRSRSLILRIGDVSFISYDSFIIYDLIQWPTFYGTTHIKLWIEYKVPTYSYNKKYYANI